MKNLRRWLLAIRPKTLGLSLAPVLVGSSIAFAEHGFLNWPVAIAALLSALFIQIGTNLHNDAADFERGADTPDRAGPARATAQGWFSARQVKRAAYRFFFIAFLIGIYIAGVAGWPIIVIGLCSLLAAYSYTGGKRPIAYSALGELFVFLFFGIVAVMGSYFIQTLSWSANVFFIATALGLFAAAVLLVNNYRDLKTDEQANKLTLVHYLGKKRTRILYVSFMLMPFLLPIATRYQFPNSWMVLFALPVSTYLISNFFTSRRAGDLNCVLARTAKLQQLYSLLFITGLFI